MRTFSEIVDAIIASNHLATHDPAQASIYVQSAITEMNLDDRKSAWDTIELNFFLDELLPGNRITVPADYLRGMEVAYDRVDIPIPQRKLGSVIPDSKRYWYQAERYMVFCGHIHHSVQVAYQRMSPQLQYFPEELRLLRSAANPNLIFEWRPDTSAEWQPFNPENPLHMQSYYKHSSWAIERYATVILMGAKSFLLNDSGNLNEGGRAYNNFVTNLNRVKNQ